VKRQVRDAREKGVLFDIGHGSGSFSWETAHKLAEQGFWPDTISSDEAVIRARTLQAARSIGWEDRIGSLEPGREADVALLELEEGTFPLTDWRRHTEQAKRRLVARHTIRAGELLAA
jgi:dihydroorotase